MDKVKEIGLYVHIPFCKSKCFYCDFVSFSNISDKEDKYIECLLKDIKNEGFQNRILSKNGYEEEYLIDTIFIGGGTPSYIKDVHIKEILETIKENFNVKEDAEITIEVNPGTVDIKKLKTYKEAGVNRLSIGLQVSQANLLKEIGRIHTYKDFVNTFKSARKVGFNNINVDLLIGLPNQKGEDAKDTINKVLELDPEHISVYSLILEDGTILNSLIKAGKLELPEDEEERVMYWYIKGILKEHGYNHYEISNYAKEGYECKHNLHCWKQKEYLGYGINSSSFLNDVRYTKIDNIDKYIENIEKEKYSKNLIFDERLDIDDKMKEYMLLGLRTIEGISIKEFKEKFNTNPFMLYFESLDKLLKDDLIKLEDQKIFLTAKGIDLANIVWEEFID